MSFGKSIKGYKAAKSLMYDNIIGGRGKTG